MIAAYSLARMRFFGSGALAAGVFLTYLVPDTLLFIPLFKVLGALGLLNTKWALMAVYPCLAVPFCTWIMIGYFSSIPKELDEAALIDGAGGRADGRRARGRCTAGPHLRVPDGLLHRRPYGRGDERVAAARR